MVDISKTIAPKSDQLNADDLIAGPRTIKIREVRGNDSAEQPVSVFFEGDNNKPYKPGLSMRRVMVNFWGGDADKYLGRSMTLYNDTEVSFGGIKVGGIRISHMSHLSGPQQMMLTSKRARKNQYTVQPLMENPNEQILITARAAAAKGSEAFREFYNTDEAKASRDLLKSHLSEMQEIAAKADHDNLPLSERMKSASDQSPPPKQDADTEGGETHGTDEPPSDVEDALVIDPESVEYGEGLIAQEDGRPRAECPYMSDPVKLANWNAGWESGK